jgi:hypothetical protein
MEDFALGKVEGEDGSVLALEKLDVLVFPLVSVVEIQVFLALLEPICIVVNGVFVQDPGLPVALRFGRVIV